MKTLTEKTKMSTEKSVNLYNVPRYRTFAVKYIACGHVKPARIKITDLRNGVSVTLSNSDDVFGDVARTEDKGALYLISRGIPVSGVALADEAKDTHSCYLLSHDFEISLKK